MKLKIALLNFVLATTLFATHELPFVDPVEREAFNLLVELSPDKTGVRFKLSDDLEDFEVDPGWFSVASVKQEIGDSCERWSEELVESLFAMFEKKSGSDKHNHKHNPKEFFRALNDILQKSIRVNPSSMDSADFC